MEQAKHGPFTGRQAPDRAENFVGGAKTNEPITYADERRRKNDQNVAAMV